MAVDLTNTNGAEGVDSLLSEQDQLNERNELLKKVEEELDKLEKEKPKNPLGGETEENSLSSLYNARLGKFVAQALNSSVEQCISILQVFDKASWDVEREVVLLPVLVALRECTNDDLRRALAVWVGQKTSRIVKDKDYRFHQRVGNTLYQVKENDRNAEVRVKVQEVMGRYWDLLNKEYFKNLKAIVDNKDKTDDEKTTAIRRLSHVNTLGSRESMEYLVEKLVSWVKEKNIGLVELTAEAIRYNRYAVLPLIDEFVKESRRETERYSGSNTFARVVEQFQGTKKDDSEQEGASSINLRIRQRIARQLADMTDPRFFEEYKDLHEGNKDALRKHAVPVLARRLPVEDDIEILEDIARILGYSSEGTANGREAIDALARAVVGKERTLHARRKLLEEYYLQPSKIQSENAAEILNKAISEARRNLRIQQALNVLVFVVGLMVFFGGFVMSIVNQDLGTRLTSAFTSVGGLAGIVFHLVRRPLDRIQNAMSNLVQMETAFTSFIWEQGLNGTYIQSQYVSQGELSNDDIDETVSRSQKTMELTMNLVSIHAETDVPQLVTRINKLEPVSGVLESDVTIFGQNLLGDTAHYKKEKTGLLAINHIPVNGKSIASWDDDAVKIQIPPAIKESQIWISLFIDGMETNALPFYILHEQLISSTNIPQIPVNENQTQDKI